MAKRKRYSAEFKRQALRRAAGHGACLQATITENPALGYARWITNSNKVELCLKQSFS
jgi:transposase-like protein